MFIYLADLFIYDEIVIVCNGVHIFPVYIMHMGGVVLVDLRLGLSVLVLTEIEEILDAAFNILEKTGVLIENTEILTRLGEFGGEVNKENRKVLFSKTFMKSFIEVSQKIDWEDKPVKFSASAEIFQGYFLDPQDDCFKDWTEERLFGYVKLARKLPNISGISMLGCPLTEVSVQLQPLYEKLYCWKYGIQGGSSIWNTNLCPKIYDMWDIMAEESGKDIKDIFNGTVYLISPLKFGRVEAEQFMFFYRKGLATRVGTMGSLGVTVPVTLAGALALHLAENFFLNILDRAFFGRMTLRLGNSISVIDMSAAAFQYGRPEQTLLNIAGAQMAKHLCADFGGHCGLSDAKVPGHEAGVQKVSSAVFNGLCCGNGHIVAGLLGVDEIFSPIQMILDDEITGALSRIAGGFEVNEETLAVDVIKSVGNGGSFLDADHTALNFRSSLWQTSIWSKEMYPVWRDSGKKTDIDRAKEKYFSILSDRSTLEPKISEDTERRLLKIINS